MLSGSGIILAFAAWFSAIIVARNSVSQVPDGNAELSADKPRMLCDVRTWGGGTCEGVREGGQKGAGKAARVGL